MHKAIINLVTENLVHRARSETIGYAVNPAASGTGMVEYWVYRIGIYFYQGGTDQNLKSDHHPCLMPNIPLFQSVSDVKFTPPG